MPDFKQPKITNYFYTRMPGRRRLMKRTNSFVADEDCYPAGAWLYDLQLDAEDDHLWFGLRSRDNFMPGPLESGTFAYLAIYVDNQGGKWINYIHVAKFAERRGLGRRLIEAAIAHHGHIYASNSAEDPGGDADTRHLLEPGARLVTKLINLGVMQAGWLKQPVI
ncbi:hypothetical protein [Xanthomonas pisi]|nr:hypothetical protein [Xanthomonas pisi]